MEEAARVPARGLGVAHVARRGGEESEREPLTQRPSPLNGLGTGLDLEEYPEDAPGRPPKGETEGDSMAPALPF